MIVAFMCASAVLVFAVPHGPLSQPWALVGGHRVSAVIGGPVVNELGYPYVATPVMLNVAVILSVAVLFNYLFPWRRYPAALTQRERRCAARADEDRSAQETALSHKDFD